MTEWYETISGPTLEQGDILLAVRCYRILYSDDGDEVEALEEIHDLVVLTQTCDIENGKVAEVVCAKVLSYDSLVVDRGGAFASRGFRTQAGQGAHPSMALVPQHEQSGFPWSIADFHSVLTVPLALLGRHAEGQGSRIRLRTPYRESLAQGFGVFFMRVGLPVPFRDFEDCKPAAVSAARK